MFPITARATKDGDWWLVIVPELESTFGQAASRDDVERVAREVAALTLDVADEEIDVREILFDE